MNQSVIVVDDHATAREVMVQTMTARGLSVSAFASAEAALAGAPWDDVALALIDWMMPGTPGTELVLWLAEHQPHVHCVLVTAAREALLLSVPGITDHATILDKVDITPDTLEALLNS